MKKGKKSASILAKVEADAFTASLKSSKRTRKASLKRRALLDRTHSNDAPGDKIGKKRKRKADCADRKAKKPRRVIMPSNDCENATSLAATKAKKRRRAVIPSDNSDDATSLAATVIKKEANEAAAELVGQNMLRAHQEDEDRTSALLLEEEEPLVLLENEDDLRRELEQLVAQGAQIQEQLVSMEEKSLALADEEDEVRLLLRDIIAKRCNLDSERHAARASLLECTQARAKTNALLDDLANKLSCSISPVNNRQRTLLVDAVDGGCAGDPQAATEYAEDIMRTWLRRERKYVPGADFLLNQPDISSTMRSILVDWLIDVHKKFKLEEDTLFLTINTLDRFLAVQPVKRSKLQLAGITALLVSAKYEEIYPPEVRDLVYICDKAYSSGEILAMELLMLQKLNFELNAPLPLQLMRRYCKISGMNMTTLNTARYYAELAMCSSLYAKVLPSRLAATCLCIAAESLEAPGWDKLEMYTGIGRDELEGFIMTIRCIPRKLKLVQLEAVDKKYNFPGV